MLELGLFGGRLLGERPGQHEFGPGHGSAPLDDAVEGGCHPWNGRMLDLALDADDALACISLVPGAVELLGSYLVLFFWRDRRTASSFAALHMSASLL